MTVFFIGVAHEAFLAGVLVDQRTHLPHGDSVGLHSLVIEYYFQRLLPSAGDIYIRNSVDTLQFPEDRFVDHGPDSLLPAASAHLHAHEHVGQPLEIDLGRPHSELLGN